MLGKAAERIGNRKTNRDLENHSITEIAQNSKKGVGDLGILAVT